MHAEPIDAIRDERLSGKEKADYLLDTRQVVIELKSIQDERAKGIAEIIDRERNEADWPAVAVESDLQDVLRRHPRGKEINARLYKSVTASIEGLYKKANRQIRETKAALGLHSARGLLVLTNEGVDVLEPKILIDKLNRLMLQKKEGGRLCFSEIQSVLLIPGAHHVEGPGGGRMGAIMCLWPPNSSGMKKPESIESRIMLEWATFLGVPFQDGGTITTADELRKLPFKGRRPPKAF